MRDKSQWSPGSIALWLIAAILATLVLCDGTDPEPDPPGTPRGVDVEFEIAE